VIYINYLFTAGFSLFFCSGYDLSGENAIRHASTKGESYIILAAHAERAMLVFILFYYYL
jgi:hypothetical protein